MQLENFENMNKLFCSATSFKESLVKHNNSVQGSGGNVDKHNFNFCVGQSDRFNAAQFKFYLEAYRGNFGSSSCYTNSVYSCSNQELNKAVVNYLNKNKQQFLDGVAEELKLMAQKAMIEAEKEVATMVSALNTVKTLSKEVE